MAAYKGLLLIFGLMSACFFPNRRNPKHADWALGLGKAGTNCLMIMTWALENADSWQRFKHCRRLWCSAFAVWNLQTPNTHPGKSVDGKDLVYSLPQVNLVPTSGELPRPWAAHSHACGAFPRGCQPSVAMELLIRTSNEEKTIINPWERTLPSLEASHTCDLDWKIVSKQLPKVFWGCFPKGSQLEVLLEYLVKPRGRMTRKSEMTSSLYIQMPEKYSLFLEMSKARAWSNLE